MYNSGGKLKKEKRIIHTEIVVRTTHEPSLKLWFQIHRYETLCEYEVAKRRSVACEQGCERQLPIFSPILCPPRCVPPERIMWVVGCKIEDTKPLLFWIENWNRIEHIVLNVSRKCCVSRFFKYYQCLRGSQSLIHPATHPAPGEVLHYVAPSSLSAHCATARLA